ncbi:MAG: hypothetical protein IJ796_11160 [Lachnospiraceae bacterium]|nr:hypothetical protein [Lachnospiraceae bacterium]
MFKISAVTLGVAAALCLSGCEGGEELEKAVGSEGVAADETLAENAVIAGEEDESAAGESETREVAAPAEAAGSEGVAADETLAENPIIAGEADESAAGESAALTAPAFEAGDYIFFGSYEQDNDLENGPEPIEWEVMKIEDGKAFLLSKYVLDSRRYNETGKAVTWETCTMRGWLNDEFLNAAFTPGEQDAIIDTEVVNDDNPYYGTEGGNDTVDKLFLLSYDEMREFYEYNLWFEDYLDGYSQWAVAEPTEFARHGKGRKLYTHTFDATDKAWREERNYTEEVFGVTGASYWLRSPGFRSTAAGDVLHVGYIGGRYTDYVNGDGRGVRPAMWVCSEKIVENR